MAWSCWLEIEGSEATRQCCMVLEATLWGSKVVKQFVFKLDSQNAILHQCFQRLLAVKHNKPQYNQYTFTQALAT